MDVAVLFSSISFVYRRLFLPFPVNLKQLRNRTLMNLIYLSNLCILHMIRGKVTFACYRRILHSWQKFLVRVCFSIRRSYIAVNVSEREPSARRLGETSPKNLATNDVFVVARNSSECFCYGRTPFTANLSGSNNLYHCSS